MAFRIDPSSIAFTETRRRINATATIVSDEGVRIGEVDDIAERIVADVTFVSPAARSAFDGDDHNVDIFASEYARALLAEAEQVLLSGM
jgi:hypothetical protein